MSGFLTDLIQFVMQASAEAHGHSAPGGGVTMLFSALLILMVLALAFEEKLHCKKSLITGLFAVVLLPLGDFFGLLPLGPVVNVFGEKLQMPVFIQGIDWQVISIIIGSGVFVDVISRSGVFTWIAITLTKRSSGDPIKLLWYYGILTVLFSAFLNNVTAIIIIGSLTAVSLGKLEKNALLPGFLLTEGLLTNVGGLLTLISSVPNIIAGNMAGISFMKFFIVAGPFVLIGTVVTVYTAIRMFKITGLQSDEERAEAAALVSGFDENDGIESKNFFIASIVAFVLLILIFATAPILPIIKDLSLGYVAMSFALIMLIVYRSEVNKFYSAVDWDLIGFFVFLFVVLNVMEHAAVLALLGKGIASLIAIGDTGGKLALLWGSAISSSVTDNIPLTAVLSKILVSFDTPTPASSPLWWSVIFGANLGGNITPIGSASTLVAVAIMHKHKVGVSFVGFVMKAAPFAVMQLILASIYLLFL